MPTAAQRGASLFAKRSVTAVLGTTATAARTTVWTSDPRRFRIGPRRGENGDPDRASRSRRPCIRPRSSRRRRRRRHPRCRAGNGRRYCAVGVPVRAAERGPAVLDPIEAALGEPSRKVELGGVLAVRMDPDLPDRLRLEQGHGVGKHDGAFEEVPVQLVRWRARCRRTLHDQVIEWHCTAATRDGRCNPTSRARRRRVRPTAVGPTCAR